MASIVYIYEKDSFIFDSIPRYHIKHFAINFASFKVHLTHIMMVGGGGCPTLYDYYKVPQNTINTVTIVKPGIKLLL